MLITVAELRRRIASDSAALVSRLQEETGRYGNEEAQAWESSLSKLSQAFEAPSFQPLHLFFSGRGNLALEYQMPAASSWADVVLLGRYETAPAAVIIELKDWTTAADRPGKAEGLIDRAGRQELHPSDQVRGYTEYCRRFHSAIEGSAHVHGCVLFTHQFYTHAYTSAPNEDLTRQYPIFTTSSEDVSERFPGKADIFRVLALPDGYTIQFRYERNTFLRNIQTSSPKQSASALSLCEVVIKLVGVVLIAVAAAQLFKFFNKT